MCIRDSFQETLNDFYKNIKDVSAGDRYEISYLPEVGVTIKLNGKVQHRYPGAEFAKAYMGIWLSSYAINSDAIYEMF